MLYGSWYANIRPWWGFGLLLSVVNAVIWLGVGGVWWKLIGVW